MNARQLPPNALKDTKILVVDDEEILAWSIDTELKSLSAEVMRAGSVREALERFAVFSPDLVITDLRLPDGNGLELLKKWRVEHPDIPVILITAHGAIDSAITALRLGAFDYLQKPFDMKDLIAAVRRGSETAKLRQKVSGLQGVDAKHTEVEMIGQSPQIQVLKDQLLKIARSKANTALILGDSGTGKELAARAIHGWSERSGSPFVEINCASIPETLLESELFGYERGAFTDARERKIGLFEIARNGSIFLDEIGDMPFKLQAKLLRALEYRRFKRLGGVKDIDFTARIIAATHRNLRREVKEQRFREDLYYRLNVLPVKIPPLSERLQDIPALTDFFMARLSTELGLPKPEITRSVMEKLIQYPWPGNIRELKNVLQRALVFFEPELIGPEHLDLELWEQEDPASLGPMGPMGPMVQHQSPRSQTPEWDSPAQRSFAPLPPAVVRERELSPELMAAVAAYRDQVTSTPQANEPITPVGNSQAQRTADLGETPWAGLNDAGVILPIKGLNLDELEKSLLMQSLARAKHNQTKAASLLGISRHTLRYRLEKHGLLQVTAGKPGSDTDGPDPDKQVCDLMDSVEA